MLSLLAFCYYLLKMNTKWYLVCTLSCSHKIHILYYLVCTISLSRLFLISNRIYLQTIFCMLVILFVQDIILCTILSHVVVLSCQDNNLCEQDDSSYYRYISCTYKTIFISISYIVSPIISFQISNSILSCR